MKLFLYDNKHTNVMAELNLGELGQEGINVVNKILDFLDNNNVTDRYKSLTLANYYWYLHDDDGERYAIDFN